MADQNIVIEAVEGKQGRAAFVDLGREFAARVEHSVPQIRSEQLELIDPDKNPFFGHASVQLFLAKRGGKPVGRIAAHIDRLALELPREQGMGTGTGMFGYFDAEDEAVAHALLAQAEEWLREQGMTRVIGPISLSIWEEPGLLVKGHDHSPMIMMGHDPAKYQAMIEGAGYSHAKSLLTYDLDISNPFPRIVQRIVQSGERNERIHVRQVDKSRWAEEIRTVLEILNDAWSTNWGFVPFTEAEIAYAAKKLKPVVRPELNMIAELDGRPVAFMVVLPDLNRVLKKVRGKLFPFGWFHLLRALRKPTGLDMRVPLMGVLKEFQSSRLASQLAFMMISKIRDSATGIHGSQRAEIGWILDDNKGMVAIADAIESSINREYVIYEKQL
ncbi:N-acetyltransferase [Qipengyuania gelatinilytica]|uniref:N-acetyltransferase n=1 Tax=Qipengyuania gelatinilytica TaxID=2867231 RepID=A0ABX9A7F7_9SPHN|nr:N-acetyltransferase [Qipengyuania gelatinilytica]QZD96244.1 N-acetyltransferase [Qipengyuania gelatinilytica]